MKSRVYFGKVYHRREKPKPHAFSYKIFSFGIDFTERLQLKRLFPLFNVNGPGLFSIRETDYASFQNERGLKALPEQEKISRAVLFTMPRYFGYVFNPVSFFVNFSENDELHSVVIEVNNTFGETHLYPLIPDPTSKGFPHRFSFSKKFFVSPFYDVSGDYEVLIKRAGTDLDIEVNLFKDGQLEFSSRLWGTGEEISRKRLLLTFLKYPITALMTSPRIHGEAVKLIKKVRVMIFRKPVPHDPMTVRSKSNWIHRTRIRILEWLGARGLE